jgi:hypothetical protein
MTWGFALGRYTLRLRVQHRRSPVVSCSHPRPPRPFCWRCPGIPIGLVVPVTSMPLQFPGVGGIQLNAVVSASAASSSVVFSDTTHHFVPKYTHKPVSASTHHTRTCDISTIIPRLNHTRNGIRWFVYPRSNLISKCHSRISLRSCVSLLLGQLE